MKKRHSNRFFEKRVKINPFSRKHCNQRDCANACVFLDTIETDFCWLYRLALSKKTDQTDQIERCFECRRDEHFYHKIQMDDTLAITPTKTRR